MLSLIHFYRFIYWFTKLLTFLFLSKWVIPYADILDIALRCIAVNCWVCQDINISTNAIPFSGFIYPIHKITHVLIRNSATVQINTPLTIHFEQICMETKYQWDPAGKLISRTIRICQRRGYFPFIPASLVLETGWNIKRQSW